MAAPVDHITSSAAISAATLQPINTDRIFEEKIRSIDARQIELIGKKMVDQILPNLGHVGSARVKQEVLKKTGATLSGPQLVMLMMQMDYAEKEAEQGKAFLSAIQVEAFASGILWPVKEAISKAFSTPLNFKDDGLTLKLSDYNPREILAKAAEKVGIDLNLTHVPLHYVITLKLDTALSQVQSKLVFCLIEKSEGVEFSNQTFTIEELVQDWKSYLSSLK